MHSSKFYTTTFMCNARMARCPCSSVRASRHYTKFEFIRNFEWEDFAIHNTNKQWIKMPALSCSLNSRTTKKAVARRHLEYTIWLSIIDHYHFKHHSHNTFTEFIKYHRQRSMAMNTICNTGSSKPEWKTLCQSFFYAMQNRTIPESRFLV